MPDAIWKHLQFKVQCVLIFRDFEKETVTSNGYILKLKFFFTFVIKNPFLTEILGFILCCLIKQITHNTSIAHNQCMVPLFTAACLLRLR